MHALLAVMILKLPLPVRLCALVILKALLVVCGGKAEEPCESHMWSDRWTVLEGESFEVFCSCNGSEIQLEDLHIQKGLEERYLETSIVDEVTLKHRVEHVQERVSFNTVCRYREHYLGGILVVVIPLLKVQNFQCLVESADRETSCSFSDVGRPDDSSIRKQRYFLGIDEGPSVPCWEMSSNNTRIQCNGIKLPDIFNIRYKFRLSMEYGGYTQEQDFQLELTEMSVPAWTPYKPNFFQNSSHICLRWVHTDENSILAWPQEWRVQFYPQNTRLQPYVDQRIVFPDINMYFEMNCFKTPPHSNQAYRLRFSRRYCSTGAPWSSELDFPELTTAATVPERPPELLPNGFYHDPEKRELYVFWLQLDELEINGPNFTYAAITESGKNASLIESNCALFTDWDPTHPAVIYVWSQNSEGPSMERTQLEVPLLPNYRSHQPLGLRYDADNFTLTWQAPQEQQGLTGYTIFWCLSSTRRNQICNDHESINLELVQVTKLKFHFNQSMLLSNVAVAASYKDEPSGGMRWIGPGFPSVHDEEGKTTGLSLSQVIAVIIFVVALLSLSFVSLRKLRKMANIEISLPEILFKSVDIKSSGLSPPVSIAVPGNFPPKGVLTIDILIRECLVDEEVEVLQNPPTPASDSESSSREDPSHETQSEIEKAPRPFSGYVMSPVIEHKTSLIPN